LLTLALAISALAAPALSLAAPKPPTYLGFAAENPTQIAPDNMVRFDIEFKNNTPSNFAQLFMTADPPDATLDSVLEQPTIDGVPAGSCAPDSDVNLSCVFGALNAGQTVKLAVLYDADEDATGTLVVEFLFTSTGNTGSDTPGRSHGDDFPVTGSVVINADADFDGGYFTDPASVGTDPDLSRRGNPQSTSVPSFGAFTGGPLTVEEVDANDTDLVCTGISTASCFGQWAIVNVNEDAPVAGGFEVVLAYDHVPGNGSNVRFIHLLGGTTPQFIEEACDADLLVNCIASVDNVGGDTIFTLILSNNGPLRGF
jgi:hypothetical protein